MSFSRWESRLDGSGWRSDGVSECEGGHGSCTWGIVWAGLRGKGRSGTWRSHSHLSSVRESERGDERSRP